ncbi:uncharacterized protein LOC141611513 [Silene latifolia]|uniref:uncharacterized protein LOC141611513 n=1 Tax=Silene latifolia TaxID=37657 RepID=UPI003D7757D5
MNHLAEVFSVRVFSEHGVVSSDELYGSIVVNDFRGSVVLFKRKGDPTSDDFILPDGSLSLRSDRCTEGGEWAIRLKLYQKKDNNSLELCNGFLFISLSEYSSLYQRPMTGIVHGRDGHALLNLVMLKRAVQATVEVSLTADDAISLYGHIHARNDFFAKPLNIDEMKYLKTTLLSASIDKPYYTNGRQIPLSRCMTCTPLFGELIIEAKLCDTLTDMVMADGSASFEACESGSQTQTIGCIQVKVTWSEPPLF